MKTEPTLNPERKVRNLWVESIHKDAEVDLTYRPAVDPCGQAEDGTGVAFQCTLERGHDGEHKAHGANGELYATWDSPTKE